MFIEGLVVRKPSHVRLLAGDVEAMFRPIDHGRGDGAAFIGFETARKMQSVKRKRKRIASDALAVGRVFSIGDVEGCSGNGRKPFESVSDSSLRTKTRPAFLAASTKAYPRTSPQTANTQRVGGVSFFKFSRPR